MRVGLVLESATASSVAPPMDDPDGGTFPVTAGAVTVDVDGDLVSVTLGDVVGRPGAR